MDRIPVPGKSVDARINVNDARLLPRREGVWGNVLRDVLPGVARTFGVELRFLPHSGAATARMSWQGWHIRIVDEHLRDCVLGDNLLAVTTILCERDYATQAGIDALLHHFHIRKLGGKGDHRYEGETFRDLLRLRLADHDGFGVMPDDWSPTG